MSKRKKGQKTQESDILQDALALEQILERVGEKDSADATLEASDLELSADAADEDLVEVEEMDSEDLDSEVTEEESELAGFEPTNIFTEEEPHFLPEVIAEPMMAAEAVNVEGTELDTYESAQIEEVEFVEDERVQSIIESILFATDRPVSLASIKLVFKGTNVKTEKIKRTLERIAVEYAGADRGVVMEEVGAGFQLRTKMDNMEFLKRTLKAKQFRLSGPALEVLAIAAYKQPLVKSEIDEIRGVESGHLLRALMEKGLVSFEGKSDLPGKPMQYGTTKKFLEIFGLRNLKELPTLSQIDELLPEGMNEEEVKDKATLSQLTDSLSQQIGSSYSDGEEELNKIADQLNVITTSSDFFEQEKERQRLKRESERAQGIRDALMMNEVVSNRDKNWLARFEEALQSGVKLAEEKEVVAPGSMAFSESPEAVEESMVLEGELKDMVFVENEDEAENELAEFDDIDPDKDVQI